MGLRVSFTHEDGTVYPEAYVRLHSVSLATVAHDAYTDKQGVSYPATFERRIVVTFYVYDTQATRQARGDEVATVRLRPKLSQVDLDANLMQQAWGALKQQPEFASGADVVD